MSSGSSLLMLTALMIAGMLPAWASGAIGDLQGPSIAVVALSTAVAVAAIVRL